MKSIILLLTISLANANFAFADTNYYQDHLDLQRAWGITTGSEDVHIAILDTGMNYRIEEFNGKIAKHPINGSYGFDAVNGTSDPFDTFGLGTQLASLIVSDELGVAPGAKIVPVRVFDDRVGGSQITIARGIEYAISRNVDIILLAIGIGSPGATICNSLQKAANANIFVVLSAGNQAEEITDGHFPANCGVESLITIASSDQEKSLANYSSYGFKNVHTAAPGTMVNGIDHTGAMVEGTGGSFSAALAAGTAALVLSHNPSYSPLQLKEALIRGSNTSVALRGLVSSNGILSAYKALTVDLD